MPTISVNDNTTKLAQLLIELGVPPHRIGFLQLCAAIPLYKRDRQQSMVAELYPAVAKTLGYSDWRSVEHSMRRAIAVAWERGDPEVQKRYFPGYDSPPPNKRFIATLAEYI